MNADKKLILSKIKDEYNFKTDRDLAKFLGIKPQTLYSWYKRNAFDVYLLYAKLDNISAKFLLSGKGSIKETTKNTIEEPAETYTTSSHTDMLINLLQKENTDKQKRITELKSEIASMKKNSEHESDHTYEPDNQKQLKTK